MISEIAVYHLFLTLQPTEFPLIFSLVFPSLGFRNRSRPLPYPIYSFYIHSVIYLLCGMTCYKTARILPPFAIYLNFIVCYRKIHFNCLACRFYVRKCRYYVYEKNKDEFVEKLKKELKFTPIYNTHSHQTFGECKICGVEN